MYRTRGRPRCNPKHTYEVAIVNNELTIFPVDNGDTIMLTSNNTVVLTDVHYRQCAQDKYDDDCYDIKPDIRAACQRPFGKHRADILVITHPDQDHVRGFAELFFTGDPRDRSEHDDRIQIDELYVTNYLLRTGPKSDEAKPVLQEIKRRQALKGSAAGDLAGNRIRTLSMDDGERSGNVDGEFQWSLLAPTEEEDDIDECDSSNSSSAVIQWTHVTTGTKVLLGGDAPAAVWERVLYDQRCPVSLREWHVLVAPHHCSRYSLGAKDEEGEFHYSEDAIDALSSVVGQGYVVSSSKPVKRDSDDPPCWSAKQQYLEILAKGNANDTESRFLNPETEVDGQKPAPVRFTFSAFGVQRRIPAKSSVSILGGAAGSATANSYG